MIQEGLVNWAKYAALKHPDLVGWMIIWRRYATCRVDSPLIEDSDMSAKSRNTMNLRSCLLFGVGALLLVVAGCNSVAPLSGPDRVAKVDRGGSGPVPLPCDRRESGTIQQVGFKSADRPAVTQAHFGKPVAVSGGPESSPEKEPAPATVNMTFNQAVQATLMADPKIRAGFEAIVQARGDLLTSSLFPNPTVLVDGLALPTRPVTPDRTSGPPQMDVFAGYPIDWFLFGKRAAAMASARVGVRQSEADYADLIRQRVLACASAFYDLVEAKELLKLAKDDLTHLAKLESITEKAVDAGNRKKVDLDRVRLDKLKSEQAVREAESTVVVAKARLRQLMGKTEADPQFEISADIDVPLTAERIELEKAYTLAQENRPDMQSLRLQVDKARADVVVEDRKKYPDVTPAFGYTRQYQGSAIGQPDAQTWNVSIT